MKGISGVLMLMFFCLDLFAFPIEVFFYDCGNTQLYNHHVELKIYSIDTTLLAINLTSNGKSRIRGIVEGNYFMQYYNRYGQVQWKKFYVNKRLNKVYVCIDELIENDSLNNFEQLLPGDTIRIEYESQGCFHWENSDVLFYYENGILKGEHTDTTKTVVIIDELKLDYLISFERKLNAVATSIGGCTTSETYHFLKNGETKIQVYDETCSWYGYHNLKINVFGIKE